jgi:hypothetical protein
MDAEQRMRRTMASWNDSDLEDVLAQLQSKAFELRSAAGMRPTPVTTPGSSEQDIYDHGTRLDQSIPEQIRKLYHEIGGMVPCPDPTLPSVFVTSLEASEWLDPTDHFELVGMQQEWTTGQFYQFAQTIDGDCILYCTAQPDRTPGSIILLDHECSNQLPDPRNPTLLTPIVYLADTLAEWLARWMACDFSEYAAFRGDISKCGPELRREFLLDHLRLNPGAKWATDMLAEKSSP